MTQGLTARSFVVGYGLSNIDERLGRWPINFAEGISVEHGRDSGRSTKPENWMVRSPSSEDEVEDVDIGEYDSISVERRGDGIYAKVEPLEETRALSLRELLRDPLYIAGLMSISGSVENVATAKDIDELAIQPFIAVNPVA